MKLCSYGRCQAEPEWEFVEVDLCQEHWEAWCDLTFWAAVHGEAAPNMLRWCVAADFAAAQCASEASG